MQSISTVMVVQESDVTARVITNILGQSFKVVNASSGNECLQLVQEVKPTVIFMDVELSGMSGFDTCRALKADHATRLLPVVFISEAASVQEKMDCYDAGGDDFLSMPFHPPELLAKAKMSIDHHQQIDTLQDKVEDLSSQADHASKAAFAAMRSNSHLGDINQFMRNSYSAKDFHELSAVFFVVAKQWGLDTTLQYRACLQIVNISEAEYVPPLEQDLLTALAEQGRIIEFGSRVIINYPHVSLLIKNIPDDNEMRGLLRDSVATLLEGAEEKVCSLHREYMLLTERDQHLATLNRLQEDVKEKESTAILAVETLMSDLQREFHKLGMIEKDEAVFERLIENALEKLSKVYASGMKTDIDFNNTLNQLKSEQVNSSSRRDH